MRIGINAHLLSFSQTYRQAGLSRYIDELLFKIPTAAPDLQFFGYTGNEELPATVQKRKPRNLRLRRSLLPTERPPVRIAWEQTALPWAAAQDRLDLLHCPVNVAPVLARCPTLLTIHDLIFLRSPEKFHPAKRFYLSTMTGWSARHAKHIIAVSEATRQDIIELLHIRPERVTTIHNGVGAEFRPVEAARLEEFRRAKSIEGRVVLYVGTLEPRKNLPLLLQAFAVLAAESQFEDVTLYIGGSKGWYYNEIFSTAERLGLTESRRVRFLGRVPDDELALWYNVATVFAYPSLYEGFGLPVLEAMSCGTPAIASNTASLPEVVGSAGLLLDPNDVAAWIDGLHELLANRENRDALGERAKQQAAMFSWEKAARKTVDIYRRHLPKDPRPTFGQSRVG